MKRVSDFPLISALVIRAKTATVPPMSVARAMEFTEEVPIPNDLLPKFMECEKFLRSQTSEDQIVEFYENILKGLVQIPKPHEITMAYAAGTIRVFTTR
jgi:hypothetical protein